MDWDERLLTGVEKIDAQHREMVELATLIRNAMAGGTLSPEVKTALGRLVTHTARHFADEEALMREIGHPELGPHQVMHRKLLAEVTRLGHDLEKGAAMTALGLHNFLKYWVWDHILVEDKKIAATLAAQTRQAGSD